MDNDLTKLAYTVEEAAELLSLSRAHLYRLMDSGQIGSISIGRSRRITRKQLLAFIEESEAKATVSPLHIQSRICRRTSNSRGYGHG